MNLKRYLILPVLFAAMCLSFSCKEKEEEQESSLYFRGSLTLAMEAYDFTQVGDTIRAVPRGVYREDGGDFGFVWNITGAAKLTDTTRHEGDPESFNGRIEFVIPDTTGIIKFTCSAYAAGYYDSSVSFNTSVIDVENSMSNKKFSPSCKIFTDDRTEYSYHIETIDTVSWFCENLIYPIDELRGLPFAGCPVMTTLFGCFFTWDDAMTSCPEGWRLPSENDWLDLVSHVSEGEFEKYQDFYGASVDYIGDVEFNGKKMWEYWPTHRPTYKTSLNLIPTGFAAIEDGAYSFYDSMSTEYDFFYGSYWCSDQVDEDRAFYRYIYNGKDPNIYCAYTAKKGVAMPVRCVKTEKKVTSDQ